MKHTLKRLYIGRFLRIGVSVAFLVSCQQEDPVPISEETREIITSGGGGETFTMNSTNIKETDTGLEFTGTLGVKNSDGEEFEIGKGDYKVVVGPGGEIERISGTGIPAFPNVGVFKELLKEFDFSAVVSRINYETGRYYKETYKTDIPLDDDTKYIHFQVLNESKDGEYELRHKANTVIYKFFDLYIDPNDPALFFKVRLWMPGESANSDGVISQFWKRVFENLKAAGKEVKEFAGSPNMIFGISNKARFLTTEYEFTVTDKESFKELYGFDRFESMNSHLYLKLEGIPIPETVVLELSGEMFIHAPIETLTPSPDEIKEKRLNAFLDWFREGEDHSKMATFTGSMDPSGGGVETIITGVLPLINDLTGEDIFNNDVNIDIVGATLQYQYPRIDAIGNGTSFLRLGGQINTPYILDLLGDGIKKYLISAPVSQTYFYFNVGPTLEDASFFTEISAKLLIPTYGETEINKGYFLFNKDGINFSGKVDLPLGPLHLSKKLEGHFSKDYYELETTTDNDITLSNGVVLASKDMHVVISSVNGIALEGSVVLPMGLGEGNVTGKLNNSGLTLEGSLKAGTAIDLGNGLLLPTADMTFSVSTNPNEGIHFKGKLQVPHGMGFVDVEGYLTKDDFSFVGIINRDIDFGGVNLYSKSGTLTISKSKGIHYKSTLELGASFGNQLVEGHITTEKIELVGNFNRGVPIAGHTFTFASGKITANTLTGVVISGNIDLYVFKANVSGKFTGKNSFNLHGQFNYNTNLFKCAINVDVTQAAVNLKGTGTVYIYRPILGIYEPIYTGTITFNPNWNAHTISACYNSICFSL